MLTRFRKIRPWWQTLNRMRLGLRLMMTGFMITASICVGFVSPAEASGVYRLTTGTATGNFYPVGVALNTLLQLKHTEAIDVLLKLHQSQGARDNIDALLKREADIAFVDAATLLAVTKKSPPFDKYQNTGEIQILAALWPDVAHLIIQREQARTGEIDDFRNLIGESISFGTSQSASAFASRALFSTTAINFEQLFRIPDFDIYRSVDDFLEQRIAGISFFTHEHSLAVQQIMADTRSNATMLNISDSLLNQMNASDWPVWQRAIIPAGTYANQIKSVASISQMNYLVVLSDFDEADAYHITKTMFENIAFVNTLHGAASRIERAASEKKTFLPYHAGSQRYFEESRPCTGIFCLFN